MSKWQTASEKVTPWFADGPFNPMAVSAPVRVQPDTPVTAVSTSSVNASFPIVRTTSSARRLVNWPVVLGVGAFVWFWLVGAILIGWLASSPASSEASASPVAAVAPEPRAIAPAPAPVVQEAKLVGPPAPPQPAEEVTVVQPKPEPVPVAALAPAVGKPAPPTKEDVGKYGTAIDFIDDPVEAADKAMKNRKILFVLHVSGDFEDPGCT